MAMLLAAANPTFRDDTVRLTSGNSCATISAVPSQEALSTTCTLIPPLAGWSRSELRHARRSSLLQ